ncbi:hypothetical protein WA026_022105 [Henosepilachna vigintioctopunctata]|uniref:Uncharacterized protein n=1 Tax=Henosepilachna vigintioctopunctata TaxID=420089 RepID=A0AAW1UEE9_9CUCU
MGRKTNPKSKEKRLQRKGEQMEVSQAMQIVPQANKLEDPLEPFPVFRKFSKNVMNAELYVTRVVNLRLDESSPMDYDVDYTYEILSESNKSTCVYDVEDYKYGILNNAQENVFHLTSDNILLMETILLDTILPTLEYCC